MGHRSEVRPPVGFVRVAGRVALGAALMLLVGLPPSGWAEARHSVQGANLPTLSPAGADAVALARPPGGGTSDALDVPSGTVAFAAGPAGRAALTRHATCSREAQGRAHARGPPGG